VHERVEPLKWQGRGRGQHVYLSLRAALREGQFQAGERLLETELAERFGVSRTPIRDALKRLEAEGFLSNTRGDGLRTVQLDQQQIVELYAFRAVLEGEAAHGAAQHALDGEIELLQELLIRERNLSDDDVDGHVHLNTLFHGTVQRASRNRYLTAALASISDTILLLPTTYRIRGRASMAATEHAAIVEAIQRRDELAAETAARQHVRSSEKVRLQLLLGD
jgi:DNA-binding GntR family transcriptional regulator